MAAENIRGQDCTLTVQNQLLQWLEWEIDEEFEMAASRYGQDNKNFKTPIAKSATLRVKGLRGPTQESYASLANIGDTISSFSGPDAPDLVGTYGNGCVTKKNMKQDADPGEYTMEAYFPVRATS